MQRGDATVARQEPASDEHHDHGSESDEPEVLGAAEVLSRFGQASASLRPERFAEPLRQAVEDRGA